MSEPNDDAFIADLLAAERRRPDVPPETAGALLQSILTATAHAAIAKAPSPETPPAPPTTPERTEPAPAASSVQALLASRPLLAVASLVVGVAIGAAARPLFDPPPRSPAPVVDPTPAASPSPPEVATVVGPPASAETPTARPDDLPAAPPVRVPVPGPVAPSARPAAPVASSAPATSRPSEGGLGAERALIDTARSALARGDAPSALASLEAHEKGHSKGQLGEERDALFVQALALAGRKQDAVERAARFRLAYPSSVFLPSVDAAVR